MTKIWIVKFLSVENSYLPYSAYISNQISQSNIISIKKNMMAPWIQKNFVLIVRARFQASSWSLYISTLCQLQSCVVRIKLPELFSFRANCSILPAPHVPGQSASHFLRKALLHTNVEAVVFGFLARLVLEVQPFVVDQRDLLVVIWHRVAIEFP